MLIKTGNKNYSSVKIKDDKLNENNQFKKQGEAT